MLITQAEWARRRGFSRQYARRLVEKGVVRLIDGKVDPAQADAALTSIREPARPVRRTEPPQTGPGNRSPTAPRKPESSSPEPLSLPQGGDLPTLLLKTRIKSEVERARLLEIKARVEAGKYVDADEIKVAAFNRARVVRDSLLNIPDRLAGILAAEGDAQKVHAMLATEIRQALEELTGGPERG